MTTCTPINLGQGTATLSGNGLTALDLACDEGFVLVSLQVGFPAERPVVRSRALADGVFDESTYLGQRAVSVTLRLDHRVQSIQALLDRLMPFMSPRRRPTITWSLPQTPTDFRSLVLRGVDAPLVVSGPKYTTIICSWVSESAFTLDPTVQCETIDPNDLPVEGGREYNLTFDRYYTPLVPVGGILVYNLGTAPANWTMELTASAIDPTITVGSTDMEFDRNGGITLVTGQTLNISTSDRTILLNDTPTLSRYDRVNFQDWTWDDLLLQPGANLVRLQGTGFNTTTRLTICWQDTYL
jgi:hypothetical protein